MAKSGTSSKVVERGSVRSAETRRQLVTAAIETLTSEGYAGASARSIADRAGLNQGLIFYHFGSVANLLLAALDAVSAERMVRYQAAAEDATTPAAIVDVAATIFREDLDAGYVTVLVEMIAGASSTPGLGPEVSARIGPWFDFAQRAIERTVEGTPLDSILPSGDVAYGVVARSRSPSRWLSISNPRYSATTASESSSSGRSESRGEDPSPDSRARRAKPRHGARRDATSAPSPGVADAPPIISTRTVT